MIKNKTPDTPHPVDARIYVAVSGVVIMKTIKTTKHKIPKSTSAVIFTPLFISTL